MDPRRLDQARLTEGALVRGDGTVIDPAREWFDS